MPTTKTDIGNAIGQVFRVINPLKEKAQPKECVTTPSRDVSQSYGEFQSLAEMTPEQINARNYAILGTVTFTPPPHRMFMNFIKSTWRIIGPVAFVVFTAWEVFYFIKHFMPKDEAWTTNVLLWGITLLIEVPFMVATYDLATRKERAAEARELGNGRHDRDTVGAVLAWCLMALVNISGQVAFLVLVLKVSSGNPLVDTRILPMYFFIAVRVLGVILGDTYTAFFLSPDETTISRVLHMQEAQSKGLMALSESATERKRKESEATLQIRRTEIAIKREEDDANFLSQFQRLNMQLALQRQRQFMLEEKASYKLEEIEADTGEL